MKQLILSKKHGRNFLKTQIIMFCAMQNNGHRLGINFDFLCIHVKIIVMREFPLRQIIYTIRKLKNDNYTEFNSKIRFTNLI